MNKCKCGTTIGMPGPPQVKMTRNGKTDAESTFVHDLPGVTEMVLAIICPTCFLVQHYVADVDAMRKLVAESVVIPPRRSS